MPAARALEVMSPKGLSSLLDHSGHINLTGITFGQAGSTGTFEPSTGTKYDNILSTLLNAKGVAGTLEVLTVNGNQADAIKLIWDFLDDGYTATNYYNMPVNAAFVELGVAYAQYLLHGGTPLTDITAKYKADGAVYGTLDGIADRSQSMHDNLLGNLDVASILDKFSSNPQLGQELLSEIQDAGLTGRPYFGGFELDNAAPTIAWDQAHGLLPVPTAAAHPVPFA